MAQGFAKDDTGLGAANEADLAPDGECGVRMIAGDHDDLDPGQVTAGDGLGDFRPRWIMQADQAGKDQILFSRRFVIAQWPVGKGEHP